jgi:hypothetical protein
MFDLPTNRIDARALVKALASLLLLGLVVVYVLYQARFLITGPEVILTDEPAVQQNERIVTLRGNARNITHLWLNDRQIYTDQKGYFEEALVLENGYTITTLKAKDRYGRETRVVRSFVYTPASIIKNNQ